MNTGEPMSAVTPPEVIEQNKKELTNPHAISKKLDPEGRRKTARDILEIWAKRRTTRESIAGNETKVQEIAELTSASYQQERQKMEQLTQRLETLVVRLKNAVGLGDKQAGVLQDEISAIKSERDDLYAQSFKAERELQTLNKNQAEIPNPRQLLEAYYEKIATQPLSNEEKEDF